MSLNTTSSKANFLGSGSTGPFNFNFQFVQNSDIFVYKTDASGVQTQLFEGASYSLIGLAGNVGGSINTFSAVNLGEILTVMRVLTLGQLTILPDIGPFFSTTIEKALDALAMQIQQVADMTGQAIKMPLALSGAILPSTNMINKLVGFDGAGNPALLDASHTVVVTMGAGTAPTVIYSDASVGPVNVNLPASGEVIIIKNDATANAVTVTGTSGKTVLRSPSIDLTGLDEAIHLVMNGTNWYRI